VAHAFLRQRVPTAALHIAHPAREARVFLLYAVLYVPFAALVARLIQVHPVPILGAVKFTSDAWYVFLFKLGGMLVVPTLIMRALGIRLRDVVVDAGGLDVAAVVTAACAFACGACLNVGQLARVREVIGAHPASWDVPRLACGVVLPLVVAGIPEELVFRGLLQTRLEARFGRLAAIVIATSLFVAWHLPTRFMLSSGIEGRAGDIGSILAGTAAPVAVVGLVFSLLWDRSRRLVPLIAAHWGIDLLPSLSSMFGIAR
jgi:membrane protease YdiL (CAAX protease family)